MFKIMNNAWIDEVRSPRGATRFRARRGGRARRHIADGRSPDALAVRKALAQLNDEQRIAVGLVLVEGLPYKEAAEVLGVPIGTVTSRIARARAQLQALLSGAEATR